MTPERAAAFETIGSLAHWQMMSRNHPAPEDPPRSLPAIARAIQVCRRCPISCNGTSAVMGEGSPEAALLIVGEQPGDVEERQGRPFIGPAGHLLRDHLDNAGIDVTTSYITNAIKHFKYVQRGKRRLHQSPAAGEIDACRWWLDAERAVVQPRLVLALGASAIRAVLGRDLSIGPLRGRPHALADGSEAWVTTHPGYLLRLKEGARAEAGQAFAADLRKVAARLGDVAGT